MDKRKIRVSDARFMAALDAHASRKLCWDAGKYLGSMLFMYFGRRVLRKTRRGVREGAELELAVYDCQWKILELGAAILTSDNVGPDFGLPEHIKGLIMGNAIEGFSRVPSKKSCIFTFTNDLALVFDTSNRYKTAGAILEVRLHKVGIFGFSPRGQVFYDNKPRYPG
jgi:hypothetical protein